MSPRATPVCRGPRASTLLAGLLALVAVGCGPGVTRATKAAPDPCVWSAGADVKTIEATLKDWDRASGGPPIDSWGVSMNGAAARIEIKSGAGALTVELALEAGCDAPPTARLLAAAALPPGFPDASALLRLAAAFPAPRLRLTPVVRDSPTHPLYGWLFVSLALAVLVAVAGFPRLLDASFGRVDGLMALWLLALFAIAAGPMFADPIDSEATVERAAFARADAWADTNHPFLPYLLNRPAALRSFEPAALRVVPFIALCAEALLLMAAAAMSATAGGRLAGALAGAWFACEVRRRHGMIDLSDWDIAGVFLLSWLLFVLRGQRTKQGAIRPGAIRPGAIAWLSLALLVLLGGLSSYLMIVPAAVLVGCLWLEVLRRRASVIAALSLTAVFGWLARAALAVFRNGAFIESGPSLTLAGLGRAMYTEMPFGRTRWMLIPGTLGVLWLLRGFRQLPNRFVAASLAGVPIAVVLAFTRSHVNGGYYVGLVTPLFIYAAAVASVDAIRWLADQPWLRSRRLPASALVAGCTLALGLATLGLTPALRHGGLRLRDFSLTVEQDALPTFTNTGALHNLLGYERARRGDERGVASILADAAGKNQRDLPGGGGADLIARIKRWDVESCQPFPGTDPRFYVVLNLWQPLPHDCQSLIERWCHDLSPSLKDDARFTYSICERPAGGGNGQRDTRFDQKTKPTPP